MFSVLFCISACIGAVFFWGIFFYRLGPFLSRMYMTSGVRITFLEGESFFHSDENKLGCGPSF